MNASCHYDAPRPVKRIPFFTSGNRNKVTLAQGQIGGRFKRELVWVLISILLLLYAATAYVYWAKTESFWR
jgi:hypothetical protein